MSIIGKIQEFKPESERFSMYVERLKLYFEANGVAATTQVAVIITIIEAKRYALLSDFYAPNKLKDQDLDALIRTLGSHFEPEPIDIAERFHFHKPNQRLGESISDFIADLQRLAINCKFGGYLDEALWDRSVCGLNNEATQKRLLTEKDLTMPKAIEIASNLETAEKNTHVMKSSRPSVAEEGSVQLVNSDRSPCHHCRKKGHSPTHCRFKDAMCQH